MVPDPRRVRSTVRALPDLLFVAVCAAIAGCDTWHEVTAFGKERLVWLRLFVPLQNAVNSPSNSAAVSAEIPDLPIPKIRSRHTVASVSPRLTDQNSRSLVYVNF